MTDSVLPFLTIKKKMIDREKIAIYYGDGTYSYEKINELVGKFANGLKQHFALERGHVIAIQSSNTIEYIITLLAALRLGVAITPLNPALKADEIAYQLLNSEADLFIFEANVAEKARLACAKIERTIPRVLFGGGDSSNEYLFDQLYADSPVEAERISAQTIGLIIYTSGTTGLPKGVLLTQRNMMEMVFMSNEAMQLTRDDRSYLTLPLFHVNAIMFSLLSMLERTGSVVVKKRFDIDSFLQDIDYFKPTYTSGVPTIYNMLTQLPEGIEEKYNLSSIRFGICGAAPVSVSLFERFEKRYPFFLLEGWGLSEGTTASTLNPLDGKRKVGSIGLPMPGQQVRVVSEYGEQLPAGEVGELIVKGLNVMQGYFKNEAETKKTIRDGWLYTGDLGYYDEDGYFYIVDRKKELIIRGGMNIYPKQIEEVIYELPEINEVAVIGIEDDFYGEEVAAFVSLRPGSHLTDQDIIAHCETKLANYRCPKTVTIVEELPKNSVGKITKFALKEMK